MIKEVKKKLKTLCCDFNVISDLNGEKIVGTFYEKELQKPNQKEFRVKNVIKRKGDTLYIKWKGYDSSFNSWLDETNSINELIFYRSEIFKRKCVKVVNKSNQM